MTLLDIREKPQDQTVPTEQDPRWQAVVNRDARFDGQFVYAVNTTGVYCRPSCAARLAKPKNVSFFDNGSEAAAAGFRPCRRCRPDEPSRAEQNAAIVAEACRRIEQADEAPRLEQLAAAAGMSPFHFHRVFKGETGITPRAYAAAHRASRIREALTRPEDSVTSAIYDAGFGSNSRFYETSNDVLGMTPTAFRKGGEKTSISFAIGECSLGSILVARSERGICAIHLGDDPDDLLRMLQDQFPNAELLGGDGGFETLVAEVVGFVEAPQIGLKLPLDIRGTVFQQRVWEALRQIPPGKMASYAEIARRIGAPKSVRAVARACASNTIAVAIPCHRVVRTDGALSGYRWGVERKRALLAREVKL